MKTKLICSISILLVFLLMIGCNDKPTFVGSLDTEGFSLDAPAFEDLKSMVFASQLIVVGKSTSEPETICNDKMTTTIHNFSVEESLKGNQVGDIKFLQLGTDDSDEYETKIKKNKTYVLFLTENYTRETETGEKEIIYNSISFEQGIFEVNGAGKLKPCTRIGVAPKLDNMSLANLKLKIREQAQVTSECVKNELYNANDLQSKPDVKTMTIKIMPSPPSIKSTNDRNIIAKVIKIIDECEKTEIASDDYNGWEILISVKSGKNITQYTITNNKLRIKDKVYEVNGQSLSSEIKTLYNNIKA